MSQSNYKMLVPCMNGLESKPNRIKIVCSFKWKYESYCYCHSYYNFFISIKNTYNYTLGTNHVSVVYNVTLILQLQYVVSVMLFLTIEVLYVCISTFRNMCVVPSMAVLCTSFMSCFPNMLFTYFTNDFGITAIVPIINAITLFFNST